MTTLNNITICISDYNRFSRNIESTSQMLEKAKEHNINILISNNNNGYGSKYIFNRYNKNNDINKLNVMRHIIDGHIDSVQKSIKMKYIKKKMISMGYKKQYGFDTVKNINGSYTVYINHIEHKIINLITLLKKGSITTTIINTELKLITDFYNCCDYTDIILSDNKNILDHFGMSYHGIATLLNDYNIPPSGVKMKNSPLLPPSGVKMKNSKNSPLLPPSGVKMKNSPLLPPSGVNTMNNVWTYCMVRHIYNNNI